jgi:hypothetical protein
MPMIQLQVILHIILTEFCIVMKLVRKMCLNETYSSFHIGKQMSDAFPIQNELKQGNALSPLISVLL